MQPCVDCETLKKYSSIFDEIFINLCNNIVQTCGRGKKPWISPSVFIFLVTNLLKLRMARNVENVTTLSLNTIKHNIIIVLLQCLQRLIIYSHLRFVTS